VREAAFAYRRRRWRRVKRLPGLRGVSLDVRRGEALGIIGRNGCGKTTLLRLLAGILRPDTGTVINHGVSVTLLALQAGFSGHLTGRENILLNALLLGMEPAEARRKLARIIEFAELGEAIDEAMETYSSGMRARLGFSTALYVDSDVLLVDEALAVGDREFVEKSRRAMRERIRSDRTVVVVSHSRSAIAQLCDRAVWLEAGRVRQIGPALEVLDAYERPAPPCRPEEAAAD
jgi:homopolymeric O-antigen transport system ATP-binding protein